MKIFLLIAFLMIPEFASADEYPMYFEHVGSKTYSMIIFHDSTTATYLSRITRKDGTTWFYYDPKAVWGHYPKKHGMTVKPSLWISTRKFRFDYFEEKTTLVEIDKMGPQRKYNRVNNDSIEPKGDRTGLSQLHRKKL